MTSLSTMTDSKLSDLFRDELEQDETIVNQIYTNIMAHETIEIKSETLSDEFKEIIKNENKTKIIKALIRSIESIFGSKYTFKKLTHFKKEGIKIIFDGDIIEDILFEERWKDYIKNIPNEPGEEEIAIGWFTKDWCIERNHMISKLDVYDEIMNRFRESGRKSKNIPSKRDIMMQVNHVFKDPDVFDRVRRLAYEMGVANDEIQFASDQIDETGWYLKGKFHAKRVTFGRKLSDVLYLWNGRCYRSEIKGGIIEQMVEEIVFQATKHTKNEVLSKILDIADVITDSEIDEYEDVKCLENGYYNTKTFEFSETIDPEIFVTRELPIKYDPNTKCPNLCQYIVNAIEEPKQRIGIWEMIGWCIDNSLKLNKAFFLVGQSAQNGKSTLIDWIRSLIGIWNISNVSLDAMANDKFATADLLGKMSNLYPDIDNNKITHLKEFRNVVTRDTIRAQNKGKDAFDFIPKVVNIWSVNQPPEFEEKGDNTYRRIYPIDFVNKFEENPSQEALDRGIKKIDFELVDKMFTDKERSGVFNILINVAKRLRKQRRFTYAPSASVVREYWENATDHLLHFSKIYLEGLEGARILASEMYDMYKDHYCHGKKIPPVGERIFLKKFAKSCYVPTSHVKKSDESGKHYWENIWWKGKDVPDYLKKQIKLPTTKDGKPIRNCYQCITGSHDKCFDDVCLCRSNDHK